MDPLARAQELHTKLQQQLFAKDKLLAASEARVKDLQIELTQAQRVIAEEKKASKQALDEKDQQHAAHNADLEDREEQLQQGQQALQQAQAAFDVERKKLQDDMQHMEALVKQTEANALAVQRERDTIANENALNLQHYHEQLIQLSRNHLEQTNQDIQRIAALRAENEEQKKSIATQFSEQLVQAARTESDLRSQLRSVQDRAAEDSERWAVQKKEFEGIIQANAKELESTLQRIRDSTNKEVSMLQDTITKNAALIASLQAWSSQRSDRETMWQVAKEEAKQLRVELERAIMRYEKLEHASNAALQSLRREIDENRKKLAETEASLQKKSQALQVYHTQIKQNHAKMEQLKKEQAAAEKAWKAEQDKNNAQIVALGGKPTPGATPTPGDKAGSGFGNVFSSLFKSTSEKEKEKQLAAQQQQQQQQQRKSSASATTTDDGPKRSLSGADEQLANDLDEEMSVSLSRRVESLEDERLTLTTQLEQMKTKLQQAELLNQLHSSDSLSTTSGSSSSTKRDGSNSNSNSMTSAEAKEKKSLLSGLLGKNKDKGEMSQAQLKQLLEEQVHSNQSLTAESEKEKQEIKRLRALLDAAKTDLQEATRQQKLLSATKKPKQQQQSVTQTQ